MNDKTLNFATDPWFDFSFDVARSGGGRGTKGVASREIRDIHADALCEKYGNNIAGAKQNSPLRMKYAGPLPRPPDSRFARRQTAAAPFPTGSAFTPFLFLKHFIRRDLRARPRIPLAPSTEYKCGFRVRRPLPRLYHTARPHSSREQFPSN